MGMGMGMGMPPQMAVPPMPAEMQAMKNGMSGMGPMHSQLNVPMMENNPMAQFMGQMPQMPQMGQMGMQMGGGKLQKYKLVNDKKFFF